MPNIKTLREKRGLSQEKLAVLLGVTANTVARWERGELNIRHPKILEMALNELAKQGKNKE